MRKIYFIFISICCSLLIYYLINTGNTSIQTKRSVSIVKDSISTPAQLDDTDAQNAKITHKGKKYRVSWFVVNDVNKLSLIANFTQKLTSAQIKQLYHCQKLVNGGFYTSDAKPLGLFVENYREISPKIQSNLVTHFLGVTSEGKILLGNNLPKDAKFAVQIGPQLLDFGKAASLTIQNDEFARRMIAAGTDQGIIFAAIYDHDNPYLGPKLSELPALTSALQPLIGINLREAVNLDGGSASAFDNGEIFLQELTSVGSFFCLK